MNGIAGYRYQGVFRHRGAMDLNKAYLTLNKDRCSRLHDGVFLLGLSGIRIMGCNRLGTTEDKKAVQEAQAIARAELLAPDCSPSEVRDAFQRGGESAVRALQAAKQAQREQLAAQQENARQQFLEHLNRMSALTPPYAADAWSDASRHVQPSKRDELSEFQVATATYPSSRGVVEITTAIREYEGATSSARQIVSEAAATTRQTPGTENEWEAAVNSWLATHPTERLTMTTISTKIEGHGDPEGYLTLKFSDSTGACPPELLRYTQAIYPRSAAKSVTSGTVLAKPTDSARPAKVDSSASHGGGAAAARGQSPTPAGRPATPGLPEVQPPPDIRSPETKPGPKPPDLPLAVPKTQGAGPLMPEAQAESIVQNRERLYEGHRIDRHGPHTTDDDLIKRLKSGIAPDGKVSHAPASTRFSSYEAMLTCEDECRREIEKREGIDLRKPPGPNDAQRLRITYDHGRSVGNGFRGKPGTKVWFSDLDTQKKKFAHYDVEEVRALRKSTLTVEWDAQKGVWVTTQHFPEAMS